MLYPRWVLLAANACELRQRIAERRLIEVTHSRRLPTGPSAASPSAVANRGVGGEDAKPQEDRDQISKRFAVLRIALDALLAEENFMPELMSKYGDEAHRIVQRRGRNTDATARRLRRRRSIATHRSVIEAGDSRNRAVVQSLSRGAVGSIEEIEIKWLRVDVHVSSHPFEHTSHIIQRGVVRVGEKLGRRKDHASFVRSVNAEFILQPSEPPIDPFLNRGLDRAGRFAKESPHGTGSYSAMQRAGQFCKLRP